MLRTQSRVLITLFIAAATARAEDPPHSFAAKVVKVADGDTVTVLFGKAEHRVRLEGIDAPEKSQAFGTRSRQALAGKVFGKTVRVDWSKGDSYGRILGRVYLDGRDISLETVREGWAWHYKQFGKGAPLAETEREARKAGRGLWADKEPVPPWQWRREHKGRK